MSGSAGIPVRTNREAWEAYAFYTERLTVHAQRLGFAGLAVCWFFQEDGQFPPLVLKALFAFVVYLVLDTGQYLCGALRLRRHNR
ncbi:MAG: hypothetical protein RQ748_11925, partial [Elusimicrobiales bacterium]|nr:hypothetical protein [Elusimicrobiales bacterium]